MLCLPHFRGLAFLAQLSPSVEGASTALSHSVLWFCLCLDSQQTHTVHTGPRKLTLTACFTELKAFTFRESEKNQWCLPFKKQFTVIRVLRGPGVCSLLPLADVPQPSHSASMFSPLQQIHKDSVLLFKLLLRGENLPVHLFRFSSSPCQLR